VSPPSPVVLWPAPGWPAVLGPQDAGIELLVAHDGMEQGALRAWADGLALRDRSGARFALRAGPIDELPGPRTDSRVGPAVRALGVAAVARVWIGAGALPAPAPPARARVCDLVRGQACVRARAIARHAPGRPLRLGFASDLHHAALWDEVHSDLRRFAPDLAGRALHPNTQVRRLVSDANARAARGELDALVLGGDLVDHVYRTPRAAGAARAEDTNLPGLLDALAPLSVPCFAIPGNHDHRLHPWRPRAYGLAEIGVPWPRLRALLRTAGRWDPWPLRRRDLDALRTVEADGRDGLAHHLALVAPATDFTATLAGLRLVFLSTGRDVLCRWSEVEPGRRRLLVRSLRSSWEHPDSEGLRDEQVTALVRGLGAGGSGHAVFLHAPLVHPPPGAPLEARLPRLEPGDADDSASRTRFDRTLFASGLRRGVFFRNAAPFLRALRAAPRPLAVFSGHVHRAHAWRWDPRSGDARSCRWDEVGGAPGATFANAPAVSHAPAREPEQQPGYLLASFDGGALCSLERVALTGGAAAEESALLAAAASAQA
jgi:hypothetical protein